MALFKFFTRAVETNEDSILGTPPGTMPFCEYSLKDTLLEAVALKSEYKTTKIPDCEYERVHSTKEDSLFIEVSSQNDPIEVTAELRSALNLLSLKIAQAGGAQTKFPILNAKGQQEMLDASRKSAKVLNQYLDTFVPKIGS
jgi:hypothetical protein